MPLLCVAGTVLGMTVPSDTIAPDDVAPDAEMIAIYADVVFGYCDGWVPVRALAEKGAGDGPPRGRNVILKRRERELDGNDLGVLLLQQGNHLIPAAAVGKRAVHQHDAGFALRKGAGGKRQQACRHYRQCFHLQTP